MKRKILALSGLVIFVAMLAWGTVAYFTAEDRAINVLTIGSVDIQITEYAKAYDDEGYTQITDQMPAYFSNVEPGQRLIKKVVIENRGKNTAWVRAKIIDTITAAGENGGALDEGVLSYNVNSLNDRSAQTADGEWELRDDGYYYFSQPIEPGKVAVLFDVVTFDGTRMGNAYQGCMTKIQVIAQAVQYEGNENHVGWPDEPAHVRDESGNEEEFYVHEEETGGEQS